MPISGGKVVLRDARRDETRTVHLDSFQLSAHAYCAAEARYEAPWVSFRGQGTAGAVTSRSV